ncbi:MAG: hypothetical protein JW760_04345 [Spirochaetales bacterium]|nr:hypothetical protein [Spirochaetales bacterium]
MAECRIIIEGHLEPEWIEWFGDLSVHYDNSDNTVITGNVPDQPALHGILDHIRDLNLTLISVNQYRLKSGIFFSEGE